MENTSVLEIKKYSNRKLYSVEVGAYVNFKDIVDAVVAGRTIKVVNHRDGADITGVTLAQAIAQVVQSGQMSAEAATGMTELFMGAIRQLNNLVRIQK